MTFVPFPKPRIGLSTPSSGLSSLIKGGGALAKYGIQRYNISKRGNFADTSRGRLLRKREKEGLLTDAQESNIIGKQNRTLSAQSTSIQAKTQSSLINQGLEGSIAGTRALAAPNLERLRELGYTSRDIAVSEAAAQSQATTDFAAGDADFRAETRDLKARALEGLVGGVVDAGVGFAKDKLEEANQEKLDVLSREKDENAFRIQLAKSLSSMTPEQQQAFINQLIATGAIEVGE